jgi:hypothetical protein
VRNLQSHLPGEDVVGGPISRLALPEIAKYKIA